MHAPAARHPDASDSPTPLLRAPAQERSRRSLDRIVDAATRLLDDHEFDEITIAQIVRAARSSVGVFYSRFADKDALLLHLIRRHVDEQLAMSRWIFLDHDWSDAGLARRVHQLLHHAVRVGRERRGLYRTIYRRRLTRPDVLTPEEVDRARSVTELIVDWLLERRSEMACPDPEVSARLALIMTTNTIHTEVLFSDARAERTLALPDDRLVLELTRAFLACVGAPALDGAPDLAPSPLRDGAPEMPPT